MGWRQGLRAARLATGYGPALLDRAVLDAAVPASDCSCRRCDGQRNLAGIGLITPLAGTDLHGFDLDGCLAPAARTPIDRAARHTVGLPDAIREADLGDADPHDGLPASLKPPSPLRPSLLQAQAGRRHVRRHRAARCASPRRSTRSAAHRVTLDGNEQYADARGLLAVPRCLPRCAAAAGAGREDRVLFIEQPHPSATQALERNVRAAAARLACCWSTRPTLRSTAS